MNTGFPTDRLTISVPEAARLLGIARMTAYAAVRDGTLPALRIGRRLVIPRVALDRLLARAGRDDEPSEAP
jgi:excisionase family DNA binding protein